MSDHHINPDSYCAKVLDDCGISHDSEQESPAQTFAFAMGQPNLSYEEGISNLINAVVENERQKYDFIDAVADAIADRGDPEVAEYIRQTDPDDDLWGHYLGPMLDSLQHDYSESMREALAGDDVDDTLPLPSSPIIDSNIKRFLSNADLDFGNTECKRDEGWITIEGPNNSTAQFRIDNARTMGDIYNALDATVRGFDPDEQFNEMWSLSFGEHNGFSARDFLRLLDEDQEHFVRQNAAVQRFVREHKHDDAPTTPADEDFAGYQLTPLANNLVRVYYNDQYIDVYRQDADPEHRFSVYRMAARWFGNAPQKEDPTHGVNPVSD